MLVGKAMTDQHPIVFIVDDDPAVRQSVKALVESVDLVARTYESAHSFLRDYDPNQRGCLVLDVRMPQQNGFQLLRSLVGRGVCLPTVIITAYGDVPSAVEAMKLGAVEFLEKPFSPTLFLDRVQQAIAGAGERDYCQVDQEQVQQSLNQLSNRERQILSLLISGMPNKDVARQLKLSEKTISAHRTSILGKMGCSSFISLVYQIGKVGLESKDVLPSEVCG